MERKFYQVSTLNALMLGNFDGVVDVRELLAHGAWGIGTYEGLDGEAIVCDGKAFNGQADGVARPYGDTKRLAFATVADFSDRAGSFRLGRIDTGDNLDGVKDALERARVAYDDNDNAWCMMAMHGAFPHVHVRSCFKQTAKPYPMLPEVASCQREFRFTDQEGWVIGVWVPTYLDGINMPGWHIHFLSDDRKRGGHLLGLSVDSAKGTIETYADFEMRMPTNTEFDKLNLREDLSAATQAVEG